MTNSRSIAFMFVLGILGAAISGAALLATARADVSFNGYGNWITSELPALTVIMAMGFVLGMLVALLWSFLLKLFAEDSPSA